MTKREIYETAAPATLLIVLQGKDGPESIGSGVVISETGLAVTNHHVIEDALQAQDTIQCFVMPPGGGAQTSDHLPAFLKKHKHEAIRCKVLHQVPEIDIAFLQLEQRPTPYRFIPLGDSSNLFPGDDVVCIGNPHGLVWTMTNGSVSAHRENVIQISAPISPGNSGGPLLNMEGELVGVNSFTHATGQNLNFARPSNLVRRILDSPDAGMSTWNTVRLSKLPPGVAAASCRKLSVGQTTRHLLSVDFSPSVLGGTCLIEGARVAVVVDAAFRTYAPWWRSGQMPAALGKLVQQVVAGGAEGVHLYLAGLKKGPSEYVGLLKTKNDATAVGARFSDASLARAAMGMDRNVLPALQQIQRGLATPGANVQIALLGAGPFADRTEVASWFRSEATQRNSFDEPYMLGLHEISIEVDHVEKRTGDPVADRAGKLFGAYSERTVATPDAAIDMVLQAFHRSLLCVGSDGKVVLEGHGAGSVRLGDAHTGRFRDGARLDAYSVVPQGLELGIEGGGGSMRVTISFDDLGGTSRKFELAW
ncbi:S1C family serine protease [Archangium gephyra]|uniref:S1C family serine protease n=1 Tax=Archangium gephyra TaxID=48 RepID=UPI0035D43E12